MVTKTDSHKLVDRDHLMEPITQTSGGYFLLVFLLFMGVCWGLFA